MLQIQPASPALRSLIRKPPPDPGRTVNPIGSTVRGFLQSETVQGPFLIERPVDLLEIERLARRAKHGQTIGKQRDDDIHHHSPVDLDELSRQIHARCTDQAFRDAWTRKVAGWTVPVTRRDPPIPTDLGMPVSRALSSGRWPNGFAFDRPRKSIANYFGFRSHLPR